MGALICGEMSVICRRNCRRKYLHSFPLWNQVFLWQYIFWNLLFLISKVSLWFLWAAGLHVPVCLRLDLSCISKMAENNANVQLLQHPGLRCQLMRSPRPVSYLYNGPISVNCGFVFVSKMFPSKSIQINGSTFKSYFFFLLLLVLSALI